MVDLSNTLRQDGFEVTSGALELVPRRVNLPSNRTLLELKSTALKILFRVTFLTLECPAILSHILCSEAKSEAAQSESSPQLIHHTVQHQ